MKILLSFALIFVCIFTSNYQICAQIVTAQSDNNQNSSLAEILEQLNKTGFPEASIGLFYEGTNNEDITLSAPAESAFYSQGLRYTEWKKNANWFSETSKPSSSAAARVTVILFPGSIKSEQNHQ